MVSLFFLAFLMFYCKCMTPSGKFKYIWFKWKKEKESFWSNKVKKWKKLYWLLFHFFHLLKLTKRDKKCQKENLEFVLGMMNKVCIVNVVKYIWFHFFLYQDSWFLFLVCDTSRDAFLEVMVKETYDANKVISH